jgi:hypothetical protein
LGPGGRQSLGAAETERGFALGLDQLRPWPAGDGVFSGSDDGCKGLQPSNIPKSELRLGIKRLRKNDGLACLEFVRVGNLILIGVENILPAGRCLVKLL